MPEASTQTDSSTIDLKDPVVAALLAWLLPGLGHWYQGRRAKAVLFFVCIMGLFCYGLYVGGSDQKCLDSDGRIGYGRAVYYFSRDGEEHRLTQICQSCIGLPALSALIQAHLLDKHMKVLCGGFMAPPRPARLPIDDVNYNQPTVHDLHRVLNRRFELAGFFATVAGLLNVLAIYDAFAGPFTAQPVVKKEEPA